ncbi:MAG: DUF4133 domain-containing protein [Bacteroidales bacterium]|nr:DUF4133 domain-containing protein [Bacteroidales bacterium]
MRCRVYRNLDRPFTLFGIQGRYIPVALCTAGVLVVASLIVGSVSWAFVGFAMGIVLGILSYLAIVEIQGHWGEKGLARYLSGRRLPKFILIRSKVWKR